MARSMFRFTLRSARRPAYAWDSALSRSLRFALEAMLAVRPGGGTLTLE